MAGAAVTQSHSGGVLYKTNKISGLKQTIQVDYCSAYILSAQLHSLQNSVVLAVTPQYLRNSQDNNLHKLYSTDEVYIVPNLFYTGLELQILLLHIPSSKQREDGSLKKRIA